MYIEFYDCFSQYLLPNEKILWTGRPGKGIRFRAEDWFMIPFSILWLSFVIFFLMGALNSGSDIFTLSIVIFMVIIGIFIFVGRFFIDAYFRSRQYYAITDRRVLVNNNGAIKSYDLVGLDAITLNKNGTINLEENVTLFDRLHSAGSDMRRGFGLYAPSIIGNKFEFLKDAEKVFRILNEARLMYNK